MGGGRVSGGWGHPAVSQLSSSASANAETPSSPSHPGQSPLPSPPYCPRPHQGHRLLGHLPVVLRNRLSFWARGHAGRLPLPIFLDVRAGLVPCRTERPWCPAWFTRWRPLLQTGLGFALPPSLLSDRQHLSALLPSPPCPRLGRIACLFLCSLKSIVWGTRCSWRA